MRSDEPRRRELAEREVQVAGLTVPYRVAGAGEPLVLVHGLAGSTRWWAPVLPVLAAHHQVYLVDLPGFGVMGRRGRRFVLAEAASWLAAWSDAVGLGRVDLVGHSMGAAVSLRLAASRPEAVRRLVLVAPAGLPTGRSLIGHAGPLLATLGRSSPRFLVVLARDALRTGPRTLWRAAGEILAEDVEEALESITAPTLLVFGERDSLAPPALGALYREKIPSSELVVLERAGHVPMFDRPEAFTAVVLSFLSGERVPA